MVCRVLAGWGCWRATVHESRKTSSWWSTRKDMACVPSPMSQKCDASQSNSKTPSVFPGLGDTSVTQFILLLFTISLEYSGPQRLKVIHLYNLKHTHSLSLHRWGPCHFNLLLKHPRGQLISESLRRFNTYTATPSGKQPAYPSTSIWSNYSYS